MDGDIVNADKLQQEDFLKQQKPIPISNNAEAHPLSIPKTTQEHGRYHQDEEPTSQTNHYSHRLVNSKAKE